MSTDGWSGRVVERARAWMLKRLPAPCGQCGKPVTPDQRWVVGHIKPRSTHPELMLTPTNWQPEHRACSYASAQAVVIQKAKRDALLERGIDPDDPPVLPGLEALAAPAPPVRSLSPRRTRVTSETKAAGPLAAAPREPLQIRDELRWNPEALSAFPWLRPYLDLPDTATPPLAMTPPQADATGSYGPELLAWAEATLGVRARWWQALAVVRILEHRADGSLCWEEVVKSCSRRSGKSVIVRLLAVWRLVFAPGLFREQQLIVHSASTLRIAKEPMRYATPWARTQDHLEVYTNNNNYGIEDKIHGHRWMVVPPERTAGLDTCMGIVDEAWKCSPEVVDDDLEPSLLERISPQLLLISTAHRRATSLMRGRIADGLAGGDMSRVLILLWAAQPDMDPAAVETWRAASPHWTPERERFIRRKYEKALRGEVDPEADDLDPMEGFRAQYLNMWPIKAEAARARGEAIVDRAAWAELVVPRPDGLPHAVAVESWFDAGAAVAFAWQLDDGAAAVTVLEVEDVASAGAVIRAIGYRGEVTVGASLEGDPALTRLRTRPRSGGAIHSVTGLGRLLAEGMLAHTDSALLTGQILAVRTVLGADGPRLASQGRVDAVKAAAWAAADARTRPRRTRSSRMVLPSSA